MKPTSDEFGAVLIMLDGVSRSKAGKGNGGSSNERELHDDYFKEMEWVVRMKGMGV